MAQLSAIAGVDPYELRLTFFELLEAANAKRREEWNRAAAMIAAQFNAQGGIDGKAVDPREFTPHGQKQLKRQKAKAALMGVDGWFLECERNENSPSS